RANAAPRGVRADLVPPEPAAPAGEVVATGQQQLRADGTADLAPLLRRERTAVPAELLLQEQAVDREAEGRGARGLRLLRRRPAPGRAGGAPAPPPDAGVRGLPRDGRVQGRGGSEEEGEEEGG